MLQKHTLGIQIIESLFISVALQKVAGLGTGNMFTLFFFLFALLLLQCVKKNVDADVPDRRVKITAFVTGGIFAAFIGLRRGSFFVQDLTNGFFRFVMIGAVLGGLVLLFYNGVLLLLLQFGKAEKIAQLLNRGSKRCLFYRKHIFWITVAVCFLAWLPMFLYLFPGVMTPDSISQMHQAMGVIPYSNHHPWIHTLLIELCVKTGLFFTADISVAASFYTVVQMLLLAMAVGYLMTTLREWKLGSFYCMGITAVYALVPYHSVYAVTMWKDVLFGAVVLVYCCALARLLQKITVLHSTIYAVAALLFCLLRSNGWYAFLLCVPFLLIGFRKQWKVFVPLHLAVLMAAIIIKVPVMQAFHVTQPDFAESICIPLQQVAGVIAHDRELTDKQWELIDNVISDRELIKAWYDPTFADNMKELVRSGNQAYLEAHKGEYLKLWASLLVTYPGEYVEAYVNQTYGYWYPDMTYPVAQAEGIYTNTLGLVSKPIIGGKLLMKVKELLLKIHTIVPLYGLLWSMGTWSWMLILLCAAAIAYKEKGKLLAYLPGLALLASVLIATPVADEFRYVYFLTMIIPLYLVVALKKHEG